MQEWVFQNGVLMKNNAKVTGGNGCYSVYGLVVLVGL